MRPRRLVSCLLTVIAATGMLAGCAIVLYESPTHADARQAVRDVVRSAGMVNREDIDEWTRAIAAQTGHNNVEMIGTEETEPGELSDPFGSIDFFVTVTHTNVGLFSGDTRRFEGCFRVRLSRYGPVDDRGRTSVEAREIVRDIDCPDPLPEPLSPPPDRSPVFIIPGEAESILHDVLLASPPGASSIEITRAIEMRMPQPALLDIPPPH